MYHTQSVCAQLAEQLGTGYVVRMAMRYQRPSIKKVLKEMRGLALSQLIILPLYPQYASATTGSVHEEVMGVLKRWTVLPSLRFISQFHTHPAFINAWTERANGFFPQRKRQYER